MNIGLKTIPLVLLAIVAGRSAIAGAADKPVIIVTQPDHVELVRGLLGSAADVKLLLPAGVDATDHPSLDRHVRSLECPTMLILDSGRDDILCRLWCERLQNNTGVPVAEAPRSGRHQSSESQRRIGENIALAQFARQLSDRLPAQRAEIATNLTAMNWESSASHKSIFVSVTEPDSQPAP